MTFRNLESLPGIQRDNPVSVQQSILAAAMKSHSSPASSASSVVWIEDEPQPAAHCRKAYPLPDQADFTIAELAREFGVTLRALRFYESKGFVTPRRDKKIRLYSQSDRARIAAIVAGKKLGFTLAEIRTYHRYGWSVGR